MASRRAILVAASISSVLTLGVSGRAQTVKQEAARPIRSVEGADTFRSYCATCHGPNAKGDGPAAKALKKSPADLTTIAKRHGGTFSQTDVQDVILGTRAVDAHGSREMPIWGPVFRAIAPDESFATLRVSNLVDYIKSIQMP